jgi:hypothetical protein
MGRAEPQYKEGESWGIIAKLSSESTPRNCVLLKAAVGRGALSRGVRYHRAATRKLVTKRAAKYDKLTFCYEAGPTGYGLYRLLEKLGQECFVVAPSLVPRKPGDRVRTNLTTFAEKATDDAEQVDWAVRLGHIVFTPGSSRLFFIPLHGKGTHGNDWDSCETGQRLICRVAP